MGNIWPAYRIALAMLPSNGKITVSGPKAGEAQRILRRHRCLGATICLFDGAGARHVLAYGESSQGVAAGADTVYRIASVSKLVTAMGAMRLQEMGVLRLDRDVNAYLPFSLRHPRAPQTPITLEMLMSHRAAIHDGEVYNNGIGRGALLRDILAGDSYCSHLPGETWEYSNLGAGIAGAVMEAAAGEDFETLMQKTVFGPLQVTATFYPQKVQGTLADARRILPPRRQPNFNAAQRRARLLPPSGVDAQRHYGLAHGNLCISAPELARLGAALLTPGFLSEESLGAMRKVLCPFGERAHNLSQGIGTFILEDRAICPRPLYGHQGMAYGACHGLFYDVEKQRGLVMLTAGVSEARRGVLSDVNAEIIRLYMSEDA